MKSINFAIYGVFDDCGGQTNKNYIAVFSTLVTWRRIKPFWSWLQRLPSSWTWWKREVTKNSDDWLSSQNMEHNFCKYVESFGGYWRSEEPCWSKQYQTPQQLRPDKNTFETFCAHVHFSCFQGLNKTSWTCSLPLLARLQNCPSLALTDSCLSLNCASTTSTTSW